MILGLVCMGLYYMHFCPLVLERRFFVVLILISEIAHGLRQLCDENNVGKVYNYLSVSSDLVN